MLTITEILKKYNIQANKNLGQNFLMNAELCKRIAAVAGLAPSDLAVEIGGGVGSLTRELLACNCQVAVVELDGRFPPILQAEYGCAELQVFHADALKFDFTSVFGERTDAKIIANLPYNVGTEILLNFILHFTPQVELMVLMLQKEVVERICAKPRGKEYGRLSVLVQTFYECKLEFLVSAGNFVPRPNVDSAIVSLRRKSPIPQVDAARLGKVTQAMFGNRRKILRHALHSLGITNREDLEPKRAEELTPEDFTLLCK